MMNDQIEQTNYWKNKLNHVKEQFDKQEQEIEYLNKQMNKYKKGYYDKNILELSSGDNEINRQLEQKQFQIDNLKVQCHDYNMRLQNYQQVINEQRDKDEKYVQQINQIQSKRVQFIIKLQLILNPFQKIDMNQFKSVDEDLELEIESNQNRLFQQIKLVYDSQKFNQQQEIIRLRSDYDKKCLEYGRFMQKQLNTLHTNQTNNFNIKTIQQILEQLDQNMKHTLVTQDIIHNYQQTINSSDNNNNDYQNQSVNMNVVQKYENIERDNRVDVNIRTDNNECELSKMIVVRELNQIVFPLKGILVLQLIECKNVKDQDYEDSFAIIKVNQLERKSKSINNEQKYQFNEQFRFDILVKNMNELPKLQIELYTYKNQENRMIGSLQLNQNELKQNISRESVWFGYKYQLKKGDQNNGFIQFNILFINNEVLCNYSEGRMKVETSMVDYKVFPLKNSHLLVHIQQIRQLQKYLNENQYIFLQLEVDKQKERTQKTRVRNEEQNIISNFIIDVKVQTVQTVLIELYQQSNLNEQKVGNVTRFGIESVISRPCQWVGFSQHLIDHTNTIIGMIRFRMMLIVTQNYTQYQYNNQMQISNEVEVIVTESKRVSKDTNSSKRSSNQNSPIRRSSNQNSPNKRSSNQSSPNKNNKNKQIQFMIPDDRSKIDSQALKKQQLVQSKYQFSFNDNNKNKVVFNVQEGHNDYEIQSRIKKKQLQQSKYNYFTNQGEEQEEEEEETEKINYQDNSDIEIRNRNIDNYRISENNKMNGLLQSNIKKSVHFNLKQSLKIEGSLKLQILELEQIPEEWIGYKIYVQVIFGFEEEQIYCSPLQKISQKRLNIDYTTKLLIESESEDQIPTLTLNLITTNKQYLGGIQNIDIADSIESPNETLCANENLQELEMNGCPSISFEITYNPQ